jgi:hypothetical protein
LAEGTIPSKSVRVYQSSKKDNIVARSGYQANSVVRRDFDHTRETKAIWPDVAVSPNLATGEASEVAAFPSVCCAKDSIVCVYRSGSAKHSRDGVLLSQSSTDGGNSWSLPTTIFDRMHDAEPESVHAGVVCACGDAALAFFKTVEAKRHDVYIFSEEGRRLRQRAYSCRSLDAGRTWSVPVEIDIQGGPRDTFLGSRPLVVPSGRLFIPVEATGEHGQQMIMGCFSDDGGRTLSPLFPIAHDTTGELGFGDGKVAVLPDGRIVMLTWTYLNHTEETVFVHRCVSMDGGCHWSAPEPTNVVCQIMTPLGVSDQGLLAAGNVRTRPEGIRLFRSIDAGATWIGTPIQLWDARQSRVTAVPLAIGAASSSGDSIWSALPSFTFGCPELTMLADGHVLMTYYADLQGVTHIRACRIAMDTHPSRADRRLATSSFTVN